MVKVEQLSRSTLAVTAITAKKHGTILQLYMRVSETMFFQILLLAERQCLKRSVSTLWDRFASAKLQEQHVLTFESPKFDSKTGEPETFPVILQTEAMEANPDPNFPPVAPMDRSVEVSAAEQRRLIKTHRDAQKASVLLNKHAPFKLGDNSSKISPAGYVRSCLSNLKLLQSLRYAFSHEKRQRFPISLAPIIQVMDIFSEMGTSLSDTPVTSLRNPNTSQEAMDNCLNELSKELAKFNFKLYNQLNDFQKK